MNDNVSARNPMGISAAVFLLGIIGAFAVFAAGQYIAGMMVGAVGMMAGGYAINVANRSKNNRIMLVALPGVGLLLSVVAFMLGLKGLV